MIAHAPREFVLSRVVPVVSHPAFSPVLRAAGDVAAGFIRCTSSYWTVAADRLHPRLAGRFWSKASYGARAGSGYDSRRFRAWFLGLGNGCRAYRVGRLQTSQVLVEISLVASCWRLARLIVTPLGALVAVRVLTALFFKFVNAQPVSDLIELPFWALARVGFYAPCAGDGCVDGLMIGRGSPARPRQICQRHPRQTMVALCSPTAAGAGAAARWRTPGPYLCGALSWLAGAASGVGDRGRLARAAHRSCLGRPPA